MTKGQRQIGIGVIGILLFITIAPWSKEKTSRQKEKMGQMATKLQDKISETGLATPSPIETALAPKAQRNTAALSLFPTVSTEAEFRNLYPGEWKFNRNARGKLNFILGGKIATGTYSEQQHAFASSLPLSLASRPVTLLQHPQSRAAFLAKKSVLPTPWPNMKSTGPT